MAEASSDGFKLETIEEILKLSFKDKTKTKLDVIALKLVMEVVKIYVKEGALRSISQADAESKTVVTLEHLEKILPQFLLDF